MIELNWGKTMWEPGLHNNLRDLQLREEAPEGRKHEMKYSSAT